MIGAARSLAVSPEVLILDPSDAGKPDRNEVKSES
jgi:hypothetical protein